MTAQTKEHKYGEFSKPWQWGDRPTEPAQQPQGGTSTLPDGATGTATPPKATSEPVERKKGDYIEEATQGDMYNLREEDRQAQHKQDENGSAQSQPQGVQGDAAHIVLKGAQKKVSHTTGWQIKHAGYLARKAEILAEVTRAPSFRSAAETLGIPDTTLRGLLRQWKAKPVDLHGEIKRLKAELTMAREKQRGLERYNNVLRTQIEEEKLKKSETSTDRELSLLRADLVLTKQTIGRCESANADLIRAIEKALPKMTPGTFLDGMAFAARLLEVV